MSSSDSGMSPFSPSFLWVVFWIWMVFGGGGSFLCSGGDGEIEIAVPDISDIIVEKPVSEGENKEYKIVIPGIDDVFVTKSVSEPEPEADPNDRFRKWNVSEPEKADPDDRYKDW